MSPFPKDINPESGFRLPAPKREDMDDYGQKAYDRLVGPGSRSVAGIRGPNGINLYNPRLAELESDLNHYLRFDAGLGGQVRELAILVTAREMDSQFEWVMHEPMALNEGLPPEVIEIVKYRKGVAKLPEKEAIIVQFGREMFGKKKVSSKTFARALEIFGPKQLVNLVSLMCNYSAIAAKFRAFNNQLPPGKKPLLP